MRLTDDMRRVVSQQRLGFVATVRPDGSPALSPKGTVDVWGDSQLVFLHIHSPGTVANLRHDPRVEVNVVDFLVRKGWRFRGRGVVHTEGEEFERVLAHFGRDRPSVAAVAQAAVVIDVEGAEPLISPAYDNGASEEEVSRRWRSYYLHSHRSEP